MAIDHDNMSIKSMRSSRDSGTTGTLHLTASKIISSREHALFKQCKVLVQSTGQRKRRGQALLEGTHLAQAWLETQGLPDYCLTTEEALSHPEIAHIVSCLPQQRWAVLDTILFRELSSLVQGSSILFVVTPPVPQLPQSITTDCVILDRIQDPGNVGSILRSSAALGVKLILCTTGTAAVWSPKVLRAGMGAQCHLNIIEQIEASEVLPHFGVPILATCAPKADLSPPTIYQTDLRMPLAWAFGNEGSGVGAIWLEHAHAVTIPQPVQSGAVESLNVAAAAAVCLFETLRQRI